jgi:predicted PurR-regulated permease PerM
VLFIKKNLPVFQLIVVNNFKYNKYIPVTDHSGNRYLTYFTVMEMDHRTAPKLFYVILFIFLGLFTWLCWAFISAIVLGLIIASTFYPLYSWFGGFLRAVMVVKALAMTIFVFLVLTVPISGFFGSLYTEALGLYSRTKDSVSIQKMQEILESDSIWVKRLHKVSEYANIRLDPQSIQESAAGLGKEIGLFLTRQLSSFATNIMGFCLIFCLCC